jgi:tRNA (cytidine/uridine-2'-O-)-methyltransferase
MHATGMAPRTPPNEPWLHVVLYQPEIPQNTGNIGRTCVALGAKLWIVRPTAFRLDDSQLKRAGLDYWEHLQWEVTDSWDHLCERLHQTHSHLTPSGETSMESANAMDWARSRMWLVTKFGQTEYTQANYASGDIVVLGRETNGLPESLRAGHSPHRQVFLPMPGPVRSLNQATCAGIVMYEAYRQVSATRTSPQLHGERT